MTQDVPLELLDLLKKPLELLDLLKKPLELLDLLKKPLELLDLLLLLDLLKNQPELECPLLLP